MSEEVYTPASIDPSTFVSNGFLEDKDVEFLEFSYEIFDFNGKADEPAVMIRADMRVEGSEKVTQERWKLGNEEKCLPIDEKGHAVKSGARIALMGKSGFSNQCKGYLFLKSLKDAGIPSEMINDGPITALNGLKAHMVLLPVTTKIKGEKIDYSVAIVTEILEMPGETKKTRKKKTKKKEEVKDNDLMTKALGYLKTIIEGTEDGTLSKTNLAPLAFQAIPNEPADEKAEIMGILFDDSKTSTIVDIKDGIMMLK